MCLFARCECIINVSIHEFDVCFNDNNYDLMCAIILRYDGETCRSTGFLVPYGTLQQRDELDTNTQLSLCVYVCTL